MRRLVSAEKGEDNPEIPDEPPHLKCDVHYAIKTWLEHTRYHTYPRAGGYNDQEADLMDDWHTLTLYHIRVEKGVFASFQVPAYGLDVDTLMGG